MLPVERGQGLMQPYMDAVIDKLNAGDWVHMFPEGTRSRDQRLQPMKRGVGRLVLAPSTTPLVVPFYHVGMEQVLNHGQKIPFTFGNRMTIVVGQPLDFSGLIARARDAGVSDEYVPRIAPPPPPRMGS